MEITNPAGDRTSPWYLTNGLLVKELVTRQLQLSDATFEPHPPAEINVAGDPDDPDAPSYTRFSGLLAAPPLAPGQLVTQTVDRAGQVGQEASLGQYGVTAAIHVPETNHTVVPVFWAFMTGCGPVYTGWRFRDDTLFPNPFYATGFPLTEPTGHGFASAARCSGCWCRSSSGEC